jgi:hypothetical protein
MPQAAINTIRNLEIEFVQVPEYLDYPQAVADEVSGVDLKHDRSGGCSRRRM